MEESKLRLIQPSLAVTGAELGKTPDIGGIINPDHAYHSDDWQGSVLAELTGRVGKQ